MKPKDESVLKLLHRERKFYAQQQKFHYLTFAAFTLILLLDFIVIIYVRAVSLDAYAWAGILLLFTMIGVEGKQYTDYKRLKEEVDNFYLKGEYRTR